MTTYVCVMNRLNIDMHPISEITPTSAAVEKSVKKPDMLTERVIVCFVAHKNGLLPS